MYNTLKILIIVISISNNLFAQFSLEWAKRYNGPANAGDIAYAIAVDGAGNVYVTGASAGIGTGFDVATIKYNSNGDTLWLRRWNSQNNGNEGGGNLLLDQFGNVYIAGQWVFKYDSNGNLLWVSADSPIAGEISLDNTLNIFAGVTNNSNYLVSKLDSIGNTIWQKVYNGPGNNQDRLEGLKLDPWGNVIVTGGSWGVGTQYDYATIKYSPSGDTLWLRRYNGPAQDVPTDIAYALAVDDLGNVYVTGWSDGPNENPNCLTIKYNPNGDTVWTRRFPVMSAGHQIELDDSGNLYIAALTGFNYTVIKYNTAGNFIWERTSTGEPFTDPPSITLDTLGNIYLACSKKMTTTRTDYLIKKYDPAGNQQWEVQYNAGSNNDINFPFAIAVNRNLNVYATGKSYGTGTIFDYATIKISQTTGINQISNEIPKEFKLFQNYPNPFNPITKIRFSIASVETGLKPVSTLLFIYDILGREVATLVNEELKAGTYEVNFNGENLSSGVYFYRLQTEKYIETLKMSLIK